MALRAIISLANQTPPRSRSQKGEEVWLARLNYTDTYSLFGMHKTEGFFYTYNSTGESYYSSELTTLHCSMICFATFCI